MPRKTEYPADKSVPARVQCAREALSQCRNTLESVRDVALDLIPAGQLRDRLAAQVENALTAAALASLALSGDDPE